MHWKVKVAVQRALSAIPGGGQVNFALKRLLRRSLEISDADFRFRAGLAAAHLNAALGALGRPAASIAVYEFGAGADLLAPLTRYSLGVRNQVVVDQEPLLRPALVASAVRKLRSREGMHGADLPPEIRAGSRKEVIRELREKTGIRYHAPVDARSTDLDPGSIDCITSNSTLEHVPRSDLPALLDECRRLLAPHGVLCHRIDYEDHHAIFDRHLSPYNFLRYSEREWTRYNSRLQYQNRLRHRDYERLFVVAGFEILSIETIEPSPEGSARLAAMPLAEEFRMYTLAELATRKGTFLLRRAAASR